MAASSRTTRWDNWPGDRQLALALEFLDRGLRLGVDDTGRLDLAIAEFGERALHRDDLLGRRQHLADRIGLRAPVGRAADAAPDLDARAGELRIARSSASFGSVLGLKPPPARSRGSRRRSSGHSGRRPRRRRSRGAQARAGYRQRSVAFAAVHGRCACSGRKRGRRGSGLLGLRRRRLLRSRARRRGVLAAVASDRALDRVRRHDRGDAALDHRRRMRTRLQEQRIDQDQHRGGYARRRTPTASRALQPSACNMRGRRSTATAAPRSMRPALRTELHPVV